MRNAEGAAGQAPRPAKEAVVTGWAESRSLGRTPTLGRTLTATTGSRRTRPCGDADWVIPAILPSPIGDRRRESVNAKMHEVFVSNMISKRTKNLLRLLRVLVVAWILMSALVLWLAARAQRSGEAPAAQSQRITAGLEFVRLAPRNERA